MRALRIIAITGLLVASIVGLVWHLPELLNPQYFGLRHKSAKWYASFTAACDSVIASHTVGTNDSIAIPVTAPSLPKIITDLHPIKIKVSYQRIWMLLVSDSRAGFGLTWGPQWDDPSTWVLDTTAESLDTIIYSAKRSVPFDKSLQPKVPELRR